MGEMIEVTFRDGKRLVVDYLAELMIDLPTRTMTYEQAVEKTNWKLASDYANRQADAAIQSHFRKDSGR